MENNRTRIALVDDDDSVRRAISRFLRASDFDVETYASGTALLEALYEFRPQCIVLDLHLEGMNGLDVKGHLSRIGPGIPVIVITGHDSPQARADCLGMGISAFLPKPIEGTSLVSTIRRVVDELSKNIG